MLVTRAGETQRPNQHHFLVHFETLHASGWPYKSMKKTFRDLYKVAMTLYGIQLDKWPRVYERIKWTTRREAKVMSFTKADLATFFHKADLSKATEAVRYGHKEKFRGHKMEIKVRKGLCLYDWYQGIF